MRDDWIPLTQEQIRSLLEEAERHESADERPLMDRLLAGETVVVEANLNEGSVKRLRYQ